MAATVQRRGVTDGIQQVTRDGRVVDDGERVEIPRIRGARQIHAPGEVDDTFPQRHPSRAAAARMGGAAAQLETPRVIDGGFDPEHAPRFVVPLERVSSTLCRTHTPSVRRLNVLVTSPSERWPSVAPKTAGRSGRETRRWRGG